MKHAKPTIRTGELEIEHLLNVPDVLRLESPAKREKRELTNAEITERLHAVYSYFFGDAWKEWPEATTKESTLLLLLVHVFPGFKDVRDKRGGRPKNKEDDEMALVESVSRMLFQHCDPKTGRPPKLEPFLKENEKAIRAVNPRFATVTTKHMAKIYREAWGTYILRLRVRRFQESQLELLPR